ncbi:hypothetical protein CCACVL1_29806 [Corchorus capsularis]|uniref:Uncharacterized protein n=1 Tax=Corchorus capsularis TaxID=210143 RepID=A0A1R3G000_COCAP|nr:hypothetical protein CCACVL1_29806 [Corchorus capsularis]
MTFVPTNIHNHANTINRQRTNCLHFNIIMRIRRRRKPTQVKASPVAPPFGWMPHPL